MNRPARADYLALALQHAARGWPVFPATPDKRPYTGFTDWKQRATTDLDLIRLWWAGPYRNALPAICPGRVKRVVIDVDRHPGKPDGFLELVREAVHIPATVPRYNSLSGFGYHYFYRGVSTSRNGLYPGVDRKARGGYVVAVCNLTRVVEVKVPLPVPFHGTTRIEVDKEHPYSGDTSDWLAAMSGSTVSPHVKLGVKDVIDDHHFIGHASMLRLQTYLVHLAREGHGGVPETLKQARSVFPLVNYLPVAPPCMSLSATRRSCGARTARLCRY
jgi:hypothetical protein